MAETEHVALASIGSSGRLEGVYGIHNPQIGTSRAGKPFLKCVLRDASGEVAARMWSFEDRDPTELAATGFVRVSGFSQLYNGRIQFVLEEIRAIDVTQDELAALLPMTTRDIGAMFAEVESLLATLDHPAMRALAGAYLHDDDLMAMFRRAPAATSLHHAWIGGLLEHTLQLMQLADRMLPLYPQLNRDLVIMGLFLHDLGKTVELTWERGFAYTTDGNLVGHIVRGAILLQFKALIASRETGERLPGDTLRVLQHIILSHHGTPEHGAARVPSTPEAIFVALLDNLDARTAMAVHAAARDGEPTGESIQGDFTEALWALDTRIFRPDPLTPAPAPDPSPPQPTGAPA